MFGDWGSGSGSRRGGEITAPGRALGRGTAGNVGSLLNNDMAIGS